MTYPQVQVNQVDLAQFPPGETERHLLFVASTEGNKGARTGIFYVDSRTDLAELLGKNKIFYDVNTAKKNAGQNWSATVRVFDRANETWQEAVTSSMKSASFEGVVILDNFAPWNEDGSNYSLAKGAKAAAALRQQFIAEFGRWTWFILSVAGADAGKMNWQDYANALSQSTKDVAADGVMLVPRLLANATGAIAGRLCNRLVTIADSPARVRTGGIVDDDQNYDSEFNPPASAILQALDAARYSVPVEYPDYPGVYWNDGPLLAAPGSDLSSIRILRVVDKVARQVRLMAIRNIGDRALNSTPSSIEYHQMQYAKIMQRMAKATSLNGVSFPGEVYPPKEGDVVITWVNSVTVNIGVNVRPTECPLVISVNIMVDLSVQSGG